MYSNSLTLLINKKAKSIPLSKKEKGEKCGGQNKITKNINYKGKMKQANISLPSKNLLSIRSRRSEQFKPVIDFLSIFKPQISVPQNGEVESNSNSFLLCRSEKENNFNSSYNSFNSASSYYINVPVLNTEKTIASGNKT